MMRFEWLALAAAGTSDRRTAENVAAACRTAAPGTQGELWAARALAAVDPVAARAAYESARMSDPDSIGAAYGLAALLGAQSKWEESEAAWNRVLELDHDNYGAFFGLSVVRLARGNKAGALDAARKATELRPDLPDPHTQLGILLERNGRPPGEVEQELRIGARLGPNSPLPLACLARFLIQHGRAEEALPFAEKARASDPADPAGIDALVTALEALDRESEAFQVLADSATAPGAHHWVHRRYGEALAERESYAEAIPHLREAAKTGSSDVKRLLKVCEDAVQAASRRAEPPK
jgi:Flp pilus assembly protein TadD